MPSARTVQLIFLSLSFPLHYFPSFFGCDVFFPIPMARDVGPVATEALTDCSALRHRLSTLVIFIYSKLFWLIKSSLKLLHCGCAAREVSEEAGSSSSPQNLFRIPLHLTLIKYWAPVVTISTASSSNFLLVVVLFMSRVFCSDTACDCQCPFLLVLRCLCCSCHPVCQS